MNNFKVDAVYYGQYPGSNDHVASGKKLKTSCLQVSSFFEGMELGPIGRFLRSRGKSASGDGGGDKKDNVSRDFTRGGFGFFFFVGFGFGFFALGSDFFAFGFLLAGDACTTLGILGILFFFCCASEGCTACRETLIG